jgi:DNA-binding transcriptional regulator YiaG
MVGSWLKSYSVDEELVVEHRRRSSRAQPWEEVLSPEWICALRATLGYDRSKFARLVGVRSPNTLKAWENGWNAVADRAAARAMLDVAAVWLPVWPLAGMTNPRPRGRDQASELRAQPARSPRHGAETPAARDARSCPR